MILNFSWITEFFVKLIIKDGVILKKFMYTQAAACYLPFLGWHKKVVNQVHLKYICFQFSSWKEEKLLKFLSSIVLFAGVSVIV